MMWARMAILVFAALFAVAVDSEAQTKVDELSLMTTPVLLFDGTRQVSLGTGFFFASSHAAGKP